MLSSESPLVLTSKIWLPDPAHPSGLLSPRKPLPPGSLGPSNPQVPTGTGKPTHLPYQWRLVWSLVEGADGPQPRPSTDQLAPIGQTQEVGSGRRGSSLSNYLTLPLRLQPRRDWWVNGKEQLHSLDIWVHQSSEAPLLTDLPSFIGGLACGSQRKSKDYLGNIHLPTSCASEGSP